MKVWRELAAEKAMIFLSGPRQSGNTTLAQMIAEEFANRLYLNWDISEDRTRLLENPFFFQEIERHDHSLPLIVFDEIHKYRHWKRSISSWPTTTSRSSWWRRNSPRPSHPQPF